MSLSVCSVLVEVITSPSTRLASYYSLVIIYNKVYTQFNKMSRTRKFSRAVAQLIDSSNRQNGETSRIR